MNFLKLFPSLFLLGLLGCSRAPEQVFGFDRALMHTRWDFSIAAPSEAKAAEAVKEAAAEIERLDQSLAMWRKDSELYRVNARAGKMDPKKPAEVSADLFDCVSVAMRARTESGGAFNPAIGPLVELWYYALKEEKLPPSPKIKALLPLLDPEAAYSASAGNLRIIWLEKKGLKLDLGGVAKGYAQDKAAEIFREHGIKNFMMNAGGQVYAAGLKPGGEKWRVGIINPRKSGEIVGVMELHNQCMSTSGDNEQFTFIKGKRYHHLLSPLTGYPVDNGMASATIVISMNTERLPGAWADVLSTSAYVLGPEKGKAFLERLKASGVLIVDRPKLKAVLTQDLDGKLELGL